MAASARDGRNDHRSSSPSARSQLRMTAGLWNAAHDKVRRLYFGLRSQAMEDTWAWRDLPVLDAVVRQLDEVNKTGGFPDVADLAASTGLGTLDVAAALDALKGDYLNLQRTAGDPSSWFVTSVTSAARREVGQWPTGQNLIER